MFYLCGPITLRGRYAVSGTRRAYGSIPLRACYAMSGTAIVYGAINQKGAVLSSAMLKQACLPLERAGEEEEEEEEKEEGKREGRRGPRSAICLRACYAMSGTEMA
eukprot:2546914-Rhodomonas_salina.1